MEQGPEGIFDPARPAPVLIRSLCALKHDDVPDVATAITGLLGHAAPEVRAEALSALLVTGRLERRSGVVNVVADTLRALEQPDLPRAQIKHIEPPAGRETGREAPGEERRAAAAAGDLRSVLPSPHSFGRRGH